jgi:uncharacterized membrane protein (GlpM family)
MLPYAVYLVAVDLLAERLPLAAVLSVATLAWLLSAGLLMFVWMRWHGA